MYKKVYFTETKPGIFEKNPKFKLKTNFIANTTYKEFKKHLVGKYVTG